MGGELGSLVASILETDETISELIGVDVDPPRRRLRRARFHRVAPTDRNQLVELITRFDPHVVLHLGVYEPDARATEREAARWTPAAALGVLGAAAECPSLEAIVVRSGTEVYGRRRGAVTRPDEDAPIAPTSPFGTQLAAVEQTALAAGRAAGVPTTLVRLAPVMGGHVPSPLGRLLRLPVVPFSLLADPAFDVVDGHDAAAALVAAASSRYDGAVNVAANGSITIRQALRSGSRRTIPFFGPEWSIARPILAMQGAPIPLHVMELVHRGRLADGSRAREILGVSPLLRTSEVIDRVFQWESVVHIRPTRPPQRMAS